MTAEVAGGGGTSTQVELRDYTKGDFTIQIGAFQERQNAESLAERLRPLFDYVSVTTTKNSAGATFYRLYVSMSDSVEKAETNEEKLRDMGFEGAFIVRL